MRFGLHVLLAALFVFIAVSPNAKAEPEPTLTPSQELKTFQLADGFEANLFASEELGVLNPMQMRWDAEGRLFVISTLAYPHLRPGETPNDKIIMLTDRNGDGVADESTVFADGLNIPTGLEPGHGGLYVGEQTELVFLKDTDGDGKADYRKVVLSGFGVGDTHQAINSFVWSPGGELYMDQGDGIESRVETPWGVSGLYQAGVMRLRPHQLRLDPFLDDFMGPGNPWGIAFDDWGQTFVVDGAGGVSFLSPAMMPVHHRKRLRTIGEPGGYCGVDILGSRHLPDDFQGDFVTCDFQRMRIKRFAAKPNGSGFEVDWKEPLLVSTHRNFRPVDIRTGPDGAIYICDWYNSIICHQDDPFRTPDRDLTHGRIWRISHKNAKPVSRPKLKNVSVKQLLTHLESPERWIRYQSKAVLANRDRVEVSDGVAEFLNGMHESPTRSEHLLFELIGVLESVEVVNEAMLARLVAAKDYRARAYAARVVGRWHDRISNPLSLLQPLAADEHPQVRMEAVVAAAHIPSPHAAEVATIVADYEMDYDIDYALTQALHHLRSRWIPAFQRGELTFEGKSNRIATALEKVNSRDLLATIRSIAKSEKTPPETKLTILNALTHAGNDDDLRFVIDETISQNQRAGELLSEIVIAQRARALDPPTGIEPQLSRLLQHSDPAARVSAIALVGTWKLHRLGDELRVLTRSEDTETTLAAIRALGKLADQKSRHELEVIARDKLMPNRIVAVASLIRLDMNTSSKLLRDILSTETVGDEELAEVVAAIAGRKNGFAMLNEQLATQSISQSAARQLLNALNAFGTTDEALIATLTSAAGIELRLPDYSKELVRNIAAKINTGDAKRGANIFHSKEANCTSCHRVGNVGGLTGPDLSGVGTTLPKDRLVQEVMWPQRLVKEGYALKQIVTENGEVLQGYARKSRNKKEILLRPLNSETLVRVRKDDIEEQQEVGSAMPENIAAALTPDQRIDLLAFLSQLGTADGFTGFDAEGKSVD